MIRYLSFDLQGTLSDSRFSDYYWMEIIPKKYAEKFHVSIDDAKEILKNKFKEYGVYHILYYDDKYWEQYLDFSTKIELERSLVKPRINQELYDFISKIKLPKIIISTTTNLFINFELQEKINTFDKIYSCVDSFKIGGKTKEVYEKICQELNSNPSEILHVGDNKKMDIDHAKEAGINTILFDNNTDDVIKKIKRYLEE